VASTTAFWRYDPQDPSKLQSNTRIVRWSDGSLTLQIASQPRDHYRVSTTALRQSYGKTKKANEVHDYNPDKDSQHYLAAPHARSEIMRIMHPFSAAMKILPSGEQTDEAVLALQKSLAEAEAVHDPFAAIRSVKEDPELAKKRAELAEKERLRAERKREAQIERETGRKERVLGRRGLGRGGVGLTVGGLEDEDGMPTAKARKPTRRANRRGDIYSDDEDEGYPRGRTREDEYDQDDGFLAASDEEPEIFDDEEDVEEEDPDVDDLEIDGTETVLKPKSRSERQETPKRSQEEMEEDAAGAVVGSPHARKKRRVIDDDDEDE
jgi:RNA polymerase-associated protein LEO1